MSTAKVSLPQDPSPDLQTVGVHSVLYCLEPQKIEQALTFLNKAAQNARGLKISLAYGDCSPERSLNSAQIENLRNCCDCLNSIDYTFFGRNLGSAAGHNYLLKAASSDFITILNPDVLVSPQIFTEMLKALMRPEVGVVEARQLPIEHPKHFDLETGETSWASTACIMARRKLFEELQGFDADTFFLYCDDVDFSWRARLAGYKVVYQSSAVVFHDKRIGASGEWLSSDAEAYFSAEAGLLLPYKYSRADLTEKYIEDFRKSGDDVLMKAAAAFDLRRKRGLLPTPLDPDHAVAQFVQGAYAAHRYRTR